MDKEDRIKLALEAVRTKSVPSIRKAAELYGVPRSTLQARLNGAETIRKAHEPYQRLSLAEEEALVCTINRMYGWGWPMTISAVETFAEQMLRAKGDSKPLGTNWYQHFLKRHPSLRTSRSRTLDQARRDASDPEVLQAWFSLFLATVTQLGIPQSDWYNMDEKGFMKGVGDNVKVIISRHDKEAFVVQPGNRDWVTIIETISTTDYVLPPFIIFPGKQIQQGWVDLAIDKETIVRVSENGWTDQEIGLEWLQHFDKYTQGRTTGQYRLLILDGHSSHISLGFVQYCEDHKIIALCLPPHSTHLLQPLDIGIFSALAKLYKQLIQKDAVFGAVRVDNRQFLLSYQEARKCISKNIAGAWAGAGLIPYNPTKVLQRFRPRTPPMVSFTDDQGRRLDIQVSDHLADRINKLVDEVSAVCSTSQRQEMTFFRTTTLTALANCKSLEILNEELVKKQQKTRTKKTNSKPFKGARVLSMGDMIQMAEELEAKEQQEAEEKARKRALRGVVGFVKQVWKELSMGPDVFE